MAEGLARDRGPEGLDVMSAGSSPSSLHPCAQAAMAEIGIDISAQQSTSVVDVPVERVGTVITLCAEEVCPVVLGSAERLHWPLPDPAAEPGLDETQMDNFRRVRDEIETRLVQFFKERS